MKIKDIPFHDVPQFSTFDRTYVEDPDEFHTFYQRPPLLSSFKEQIADKQRTYSFDRDLLTQCIEDQYLEIDLLSKNVKKNIERLKSDDTFTIITAHQPSLFTGPLYFIYKILSVIQTAAKVEEEHKGYNVVPVFIIGGEDHDFEEINHFHYKDHKFTWKESKGGAVGRMPVDNIGQVIKQIEPHLSKSFYGKEILQLIRAAYSSDRSYSQATQYFVAQLFEKYPLLVVSMDDAEMKRAFIPFIKKEIFEKVSEDVVRDTQSQLENLGFSAQAHAREINFFYLDEGSRSRIVYLDGEYIVQEGGKSFSRESLEAEIERRPERFSPNVVMRPIYQEFVFPNLAYIGGGGELAYWMERKQQFNIFKLSFPILIRRHSATLLDKNRTEKAKSFPWDWNYWFKDRDYLIKELLNEQHQEELDFSKYYAQLHDVYDHLGDKMEDIDPTLDYSAEAGRADSLKIMERLHTKVLRALKKKEDVQLNRMDAVFAQMFPEGSLQERHDNFIAYYESHGPKMLEYLLEAFPAFDVKMMLLTDL